MKAANFGKCIILTTSIVFAAAGAASGQQPTRGPRIGVPTQMIAPDATALTVNYPGGTLEAFVQALRESTKDPVNISLQGDASKLRVEPLMLREVSVEAALRAALGRRANGESLGSDGLFMGTRLEVIEQGAEGKAVFVVTTQPIGRGPGSPPDTAVDVLSILQLVRSDDKGGGPTVPEQVVLSAIDTGLKLNHVDGATQPEINYHKDSGLLLVRGQPRDIAIVRDIIHRMTDDQERRIEEHKRRTKTELRQRAQMQRAEIQLGFAAKQLSSFTSRMEQVQELVKQGGASSSELADLQLSVARAKADLDLAQVERDRLKREADAGIEDDDNVGAPVEDDTSAAATIRRLSSQLNAANSQIQQIRQAYLDLYKDRGNAPPPDAKVTPKGQ